MPPTLAAVLNSMTPEVLDAFLLHLNGGTSAEYLADWLRRAGYQCSATTIKRYRRGYM